MNVIFEKERLTARNSSGVPMGSVSFPRVRCGLVNISDVSVLPAFRGQGAEDAMMEAVLEHLDRQGLKAALTAPFAQQYIRMHPQWNHILPGEISFTKY